MDERAVTANSLDDAILQAVRSRIADLMEKEAQAAKTRVLAQLCKEMDQLALQILSYYDVERHGQNLRITVRKPDLSDKADGT